MEGFSNDIKKPVMLNIHNLYPVHWEWPQGNKLEINNKNDKLIKSHVFGDLKIHP